MSYQNQHTVESVESDEILGLQKLEDFKTDSNTDELLARMGVLPDNHPLTQYTRSLFSKIANPGEKIEVLIQEAEDKINAFAVSDGRIVLSRQLVEFCETDEELLYILAHEQKHIREKHSKKLFEEAKKESLMPQDRVRVMGMLRVFEMGEADIEAAVELDNKGINIDGAFTFIRRLGEKQEGKNPIDLEHGSLEDRLLAFKSILLFKDLHAYKEGRQNPKPQNLKDANLYKDTRGFPMKGSDAVTKDEVWQYRANSIENMSSLELRVNKDDLKNAIIEAEEQNIRLMDPQSKSRIKDRIIAENNKYLLKAKPFYEKMNALFLKKTVGIGLTEEHLKATDRINDSLNKIYNDYESSDSLWDDLLQDAQFLKDLNELKSADLMKWATIFRGSKYPKLHDDILEALDNNFHDEEEKTFATQILSLLLTGKWHEDKVKNPLNKKMDADIPDDWLIIDAEIIDSFLDFSRNMEIERSRKRKEETDAYYEDFEPDEYSLNHQWDLLMSKIKARNKIAPYSENFNRLFETIKNLFQKGHYKNHISIANEIFNTVTDPYEQNLLLTFLASTTQNSKIIISNANNTEIIKSDISVFLEKVDTLAKQGSYKLSEITEMIVEHMFAQSCSTDFKEGMDILEHIKNHKCATEKYIHAFLRGWIQRLTNFTLEDIESLDSDLIKKSDSLSHMDSVIKQQLANHIGSLVKDRETLTRFLNKIGEMGIDKSLGAYMGNEKEENFLAFYNLMKCVDFNIENLNDDILLLRIARLAPNKMEGYAMEQNIWNAILEKWEINNFTIKGVLEKIPKSLKIPLEIMNRIIEEHTENEEDLELCKSYLIESLKEPFDVGKVIIFNEIISRLTEREKLRFLKVLLKRENDNELKALLLEHCSLDRGKEKQFLNTLFPDNIEFDEKFKDISVLGKADMETSPERILKALYSTDLSQRRIIIHLFLTGPGGILNKAQEMEEVIDLLFEEYVKKEDDADFVKDVKKILKIAIRQAKPEDLYMILSDLFAKRILQAEYRDNWKKIRQFATHKENILNILNRRDGISNEDDIHEPTEAFETDSPESLEKAVDLSIYGRISDAETGFEMEKKGLEHLLTLPKKAPKTEKMDAVGLLLELAHSLKSIGTRGLQVADMYMDLPEKYQGLRNRIYSDMDGQSKITAYETIVRNIPPAQRQNLRLGKKIGGGAMVTVYPFGSDTLEGVVKVLNPNIEAFTDTTFEILEKTFKKLIKKNPERYAALGILLEDIRWWVLADMDLASSTELDQIFTAQNQGFNTDVSELSIHIPEVKYRDKRCLIEANINGRSLDKDASTEAEIRQMLELIRANVRMQVVNGIMHSDVHPGNLAKTEHGNVAWLDRTLLLKLRPEDQMLLYGVEMADTDDQKFNAVLEGLFQLPENRNLGENRRSELRTEAEKIQGKSMEDRIKKLSTTLRRHKDFNIPPHMTLVFKNMMALNKLGERIGKGEIVS